MFMKSLVIALLFFIISPKKDKEHFIQIKTATEALTPKKRVLPAAGVDDNRNCTAEIKISADLVFKLRFNEDEFMLNLDIPWLGVKFMMMHSNR